MRNLRSLIEKTGMRRMVSMLMALMMLASSAPLPALAEGEAPKDLLSSKDFSRLSFIAVYDASGAFVSGASDCAEGGV